MSFLSQPLSLLSAIFPNNRMIGDIPVQVVTNENTTDTLTITKQPVQQGASISDHAFMEPVSLTMTLFFQTSAFPTSFASLFNSGSGLSAIYTQLRNLQTSRVPFTVVTPKRTYTQMLIASLGNTTDKNTENCLSITLGLQQVLIVDVVTIQAPPANQIQSGATQATQTAGNKSVLLSGTQTVGSLRSGIK